MTTSTIKLPQIDYEGFKMLKGSDIVLEFTQDYMHYQAWCDCIQRDPDKELDLEKHFENKVTIDKNSICSIEMQWSCELKHYDVLVRTNANDYVCIKVNGYKDAEKLRSQFVDWKYKNIMPK